MREFIYFSKKASTSGNFGDLKGAGRLDIVCNVIIHTFFISNNLRRDVRLHLIFYGEPNPPRHIILEINKNTPVSKKDLGGLLKRILFKGENLEKERKVRVFPGCWIENKSFLKVIEELKDSGREILVLNRRGKDIQGVDSKILENAVFVLGDQEGLPKKEFQRLRKNEKLVSLGKVTYFSSQSVIIVHNKLDRLEI
jgi:tRNA (pseudouridine54-N1)-methyltransferase